ncbi:uncharacterized protein PADG_07692 [Paracoccidioides brasiliensis Pb18]|uniref:Myb-like domain-containing protein n=2 Tax=Paracoccidioides brasiliensis TaxID=121759 RepID=C1GKA6_PARBD|nr:uncharacterized protein PADG_07692 [Paracoccidioides brasiliensis Pb18]EEH42872.2 hypothetical protein PADG_07692 [Paracoccidioides brasiliensis Pb18]ODH39919.1 hypothetical protein ACO22_01748 [Paracoccidioides brasiliensis]ODH53702.1 hypothetical protein GX48_00120 [Paracoccidioides brasiliensis]
MPKQTSLRGSKRSRPYPDPKTRPMMSNTKTNPSRTPAAAVGATARRPPPAWEHHQTSPSSMPPPRFSMFDRRVVQDCAAPLSPTTPSASSSPSVPWSPHDDKVLMSARALGHGWSQIQKENFHSKSPNACRKRHERLVAKRRGSEWEDERVEKVTRHYHQMRRDIWRPLAEAAGENWEDVEKICLTRGQRNLLPMPTHSSIRRLSSDNESRGSHESHDEEKLRIPNLIR